VQTDVVAVVLAVRGPDRRWRGPFAILVALAIHVSLWRWAQPSASLAGPPARRPAAPAHDRTIDLTPPPPPPPVVEEPRAPPPVKPASIQPARRPPPAQAGAILAQASDPEAPLDLTAESFVTGTAQAYAGGTTASAGTSPAAVQARDVDPRSEAAAPSVEPDLSTAVALEDESWSCPWPPEADTEQVDEQTVIIRVVVAPDGKVEAAEVVSDPGGGFGAAATTCARQTRFTPARDRRGAPTRATSPPIRVRFTR
jgi:periplasmic protein TonB